MSREATIAAAIAAELNDPLRSWHIPTAVFEADWHWHAVYTPTTLRTLQVRVVPMNLDEEQLRQLTAMTYEFAVDFQQLVSPEDRSEIAALADLVEAVGDWFRDPHVLSAPWAVTEARMLDSALFNLLHQERQWESALLVRVRGVV